MGYNPKVSVIIPSYNREGLIGETIESVRRQSYSNLECIVVDDGSSDNTLKVVQSFVEKDNRIILFPRPLDKPKGANACRNYGVQKSTGDYVIFLDSDDVLKGNCLEGRVLRFKQNINCNYIVFLMGSYNGKLFVDNTNKVEIQTNQEALKLFFRHNYPWNISGPIWKRSFLVKNQGFDEELFRYQDVDLHIRLLMEKGSIYKRFNITDCYYRINEETRKNVQIINYQSKIVKSYYRLLQSFFIKTPSVDLSYYENDIKYSYFRQIMKYYHNYNIPIFTDLEKLVQGKISFSLKEKYLIFLFKFIRICCPNKRGSWFVTKPIIKYFNSI